jgi:hypothetical protein
MTRWLYTTWSSDAFFFKNYTRSILMALSTEELKNAIEEKATTSPKPQLYIKDFYACDPDSKPRVIKNVANEMVREGRLMFWSSGSTTMYGIPSRIQDEEVSK